MMLKCKGSEDSKGKREVMIQEDQDGDLGRYKTSLYM
jgi:hypothetical protein